MADRLHAACALPGVPRGAGCSPASLAVRVKGMSIARVHGNARRSRAPDAAQFLGT